MLKHISSIDDPRLFAYRNLKDRELARLDGRFIAESDLIVRRLLASDFQVESVLVASRKAETIAPVVPPHIPLYVISEEQLDSVVGFQFHTGVLAVGLRRILPTIEKIIPPPPARSTIVILPELTNPENMGSLIRISSAMGVDALVLGPSCCDPFYRLSVRVSMGTVFTLPIVQSNDLLHDLARFGKEFGYQLAATVLSDDAELLNDATRPDRFALLFGNEANGLAPSLVTACDRRITLPMRNGTDSLNVAIAAGIFLYHFTRE